MHMHSSAAHAANMTQQSGIQGSFGDSVQAGDQELAEKSTVPGHREECILQRIFPALLENVLLILLILFGAVTSFL